MHARVNLSYLSLLEKVTHMLTCSHNSKSVFIRNVSPK